MENHWCRDKNLNDQLLNSSAHAAGQSFSLQLEKEVPYLRHCKSTFYPFGAIRAVLMEV